MFGVDGAFVGPANPVDDIAGDELPWEVSRAFGSLARTAHLFVAVRGLVFEARSRLRPSCAASTTRTSSARR